MSLGERIALARKQAGLSQEQLGEKLGVSRQAVSKWESGQTNPDVAYVAQMCRLMGVSSDWLLLGEERARSDAPERCPGCQAIVSGLDRFCPNCGRGLRSGGPDSYILLLKPVKNGDISPREDLVRLSKAGIFSEPPLDKFLSYQQTEAIADAAPLVLGRGLTAEQVYRAWDSLIYTNRFLFLRDCGVEDPWALLDYPEVDPKTLGVAAPKEPMSFGMTALAVVVGIIGAAIVLMFL